MDQSLKDFRAAIQKALQTGDTTKVATSRTARRLSQSPGWKSALVNPESKEQKPKV